MSSILLKNITLNGTPSDVIISEGIIKKILPSGKIQELPLDKETAPTLIGDAEVVDCSGKTALPGFVNMHTHAAMSLMRGMKEDAALHEWLSKIWQLEANLNDELVYWGTKVAALEMIKTGTTTFNDQYWYLPSAHKAAIETGVRPVLSYVILDNGNPDEAARQKEQCQRRYEESLKWNDGSIFSIAIHAVYTVSEEMILWATEFARSHGLILQLHLSETLKEVLDCKAAHGGLTPVQYLDSLGVFDSRVNAAHSLWLSPEDVKILGERKVNCVHNINSNTKLSSGYKFLYNELRDAGANICIGTDGCASSNNLDMLEAMKTSAIIQKAWREDPKVWPLEELFACGTINGAKALRVDTGIIEEGKIADILIVNTDSSFFLSNGPFLANLVYSAHSDCIESVIVNGKFVMRGRRVEGEEEILSNARRIISELQ